MKSAYKRLLFILFLMTSISANADTCKGKFANPITDICWSCVFPIRISGLSISSIPGLSSLGSQEDTPNPGGPACYCGTPIPKVGVKVSFWEPTRRVDVVREPWCMTSLGGVKMNPGFDAPASARRRKDSNSTTSFYQAHWYVDPILFYLQAILDSGCLENTGFDVGYFTELDPLWNDDELTRIINPDVYLFGGLVARAACAADCVAATIGWPNELFYWCAGCNGQLYPLNGNVAAHVGGVQASSLIMYRLIAKMHREGLMWAASGSDGLCGYYPQILMNRTGYKYNMLYPIPQTAKIAGKCCQPLGRTTTLWGAGREFPYAGEDFAYQIFRKRNCCQGAF